MGIIKFRKVWSISFFLGAMLSAAVVSVVGEGVAPTSHVQQPWTQSRASQLVFFAVLEGLYRDGVSNDTVDLIIPPGANGAARFEPEHFVYACPLCHPAFEAFSLYRHRKEIFGFKG